MIKHVLFAVIPMLMFAGSVKADDFMTELSGLDASSIVDADISIEASAFDIDVDSLSAEAGEEGEVAIEACFRRFGYRSCGYGYGYNCHRYNYCYRPCYRPCYTQYYSYRPCYNYSYCYRPVHHVSYWGCY